MLRAATASGAERRCQRRRCPFPGVAPGAPDRGSLRSRQGTKPDTRDHQPLNGRVAALAGRLKERARALQAQVAAKARQQFASELQELMGRTVLAANLEAVLAEVEKKKRIAAYGLCLADTKTQTITAKSTSVTRAAVTQKLIKSFRDELASLRFNKIEVELAGRSRRCAGKSVPQARPEERARCRAAEGR